MKTIFCMKNLMLPLALAALVFTTACNKDDEDQPAGKTDLLTAKSWVLKAITVSPAYDWFGNGSPITDIYAIFPACSKDDFVTFLKDGKAILDEGQEKCFEEDPQKRQATWTFQSNETIISITEDGETQQWDVVKLTATEMVVDYSIVDDGENYTFTATYRTK